MKKLVFILLLAPVLYGNGQASIDSTKTGVYYVDVDYIISQMPEGKTMQEKVLETQTSLRNEYSEKQKQFQEEYQMYQANSASMPDSTRGQAENYLRGFSEELRAFPQQAQQSIEKTRQFYLITANLKISNAIRNLSTANGVSLILPTRIGGVDFILYAAPSLDISNLVIEAVVPKTEPVPEEKEDVGAPVEKKELVTPSSNKKKNTSKKKN